MTALQSEGLIVLRSGTCTLRIAPPLVITTNELEKGLSIIETVCAKAL
jgi:acetylornithine/succinyldiaminopimelate/putrescine aminotransferase